MAKNQPRKARKVEQLQVECPACGNLVAVDKKTGDVVSYASTTPPAPTPEPDPAEKPGEPAPNDIPNPAGTDDDEEFLSGW